MSTPASALATTLASFATEVVDADEEVFDLFSGYGNAADLGILSKADKVEVSVGEREFVLAQSRSLLAGKREGGTTGAVIWSISPPFASWISNQRRPLLRHGLVTSSSTVLELGAGVSPLSALSLAPHVRRYVLSDQDYVLKMLRGNVAANLGMAGEEGTRQREGRKQKGKAPGAIPSSRGENGGVATAAGASNIETIEVDWESTEPVSVLRYLQQDQGKPDQLSNEQPLHAILATDCVFNEAIIDPFVDMLAALSSPNATSSHLNSIMSTSHTHSPPTSISPHSPVLSIIAQQLRAPDVFNAWLEAMLPRFRVWRVEESEVAADGMGVAQGFVVHVCHLK